MSSPTPNVRTYSPCPFCGSAHVRATKDLREGYGELQDDPDAYAHYVICFGCAAQGGWAKTESGAVRLWEARHS